MHRIDSDSLQVVLRCRPESALTASAEARRKVGRARGPPDGCLVNRQPPSMYCRTFAAFNPKWRIHLPSPFSHPSHSTFSACDAHSTSCGASASDPNASFGPLCFSFGAHLLPTLLHVLLRRLCFKFFPAPLFLLQHTREHRILKSKSSLTTPESSGPWHEVLKGVRFYLSP